LGCTHSHTINRGLVGPQGTCGSPHQPSHFHSIGPGWTRLKATNRAAHRWQPPTTHRLLQHRGSKHNIAHELDAAKSSQQRLRCKTCVGRRGERQVGAGCAWSWSVGLDLHHISDLTQGATSLAWATIWGCAWTVHPGVSAYPIWCAFPI